MPERQEQLTVIGPDTLVRGEVVSQSAALILGKVEGKIQCQGHLQIGPGALCKASIHGVTICIEGTVEGDVLATDKLELKPTAIVKGDITAAKLLTSEGAAFSGHCAIGSDAVAAAQRAEGSTHTSAQPAISTPSHSNAHTPPRLAITPTSTAAAAPTKPSIITTPNNTDVDSALAGLEAKLAGFSRARATAE